MSIKNLKPITNGKYKQNYYICQNPFKYDGLHTEIIYRSSWEQKFMVWCDLSPSVIKWSNETVVVPYISPIDKKTRRYYIDFYVEVLDRDGIVKKFLVEIKPKFQYHQDYIPKFNKMNDTTKKRSSKKLETYKKEVETYVINNAKFEAARYYASHRGLEFKIINEEILKIQK